MNNNNTVSGMPLGMAWYKFLIYFGLIAGAVINILYGVNYFFGGIYYVVSNGEISAEVVYDYYGNGLQAVDVLYGFYLIAIAVFAFILRSKLAKYESDSLKFVTIFYAAMGSGSLLYFVLVAAITGLSRIGEALVGQAVLMTIAGFVVLFCNVKYFGKRSHLFKNKPISIFGQQVNEIETEQPKPKDMPPAPATTGVYHEKRVEKEQMKSEDGEVVCEKCNHSLPSHCKYCVHCGSKVKKEEVRFCHKCGMKLMENAKFCCKCGAKIFSLEDMQ